MSNDGPAAQLARFSAKKTSSVLVEQPEGQKWHRWRLQFRWQRGRMPWRPRPGVGPLTAACQRRAGIVLAPPSFFHPQHANSGVQVDGLPPAVLARDFGNGGGSGLGPMSEAPPAPDASR